jgi:hypothetical protein
MSTNHKTKKAIRGSSCVSVASGTKHLLVSQLYQARGLSANGQRLSFLKTESRPRARFLCYNEDEARPPGIEQGSAPTTL